jgi:hypothetical protein
MQFWHDFEGFHCPYSQQFSVPIISKSLAKPLFTEYCLGQYSILLGLMYPKSLSPPILLCFVYAMKISAIAIPNFKNFILGTCISFVSNINSKNIFYFFYFTAVMTIGECKKCLILLGV